MVYGLNDLLSLCKDSVLAASNVSHCTEKAVHYCKQHSAGKQHRHVLYGPDSVSEVLVVGVVEKGVHGC